MTDNTEQEEFWNGRMGSAWVDVEDRIDRMLEPLSRVAVERVGAEEGQRVIDVGCGCGTTSLSLAEDGASIWGVDISHKMIERAKEKSSGVDNVHFSVADAAAQPYTNDHHYVFSRFGIMFFADPVAAFANLKTSLVDDGRLVFLCWQPPAKNPWITIAAAALQEFQPQDAPPPDPSAPGPFAFGDPDYTRRILGDAGYRDVQIEPVEKEIQLGENLEQAMEFQRNIGPLSALLETLDEARQGEAVDCVASAFSEYVTDSGIHLDAASLLVTAKV